MILEVKNMSYYYKSQRDKLILDHVSYGFECGKLYAILGPSGSGKTTLLSLLAGLDVPIQGEICYDGKPITTKDLAEHRCHHISLVFQSYNLWTHMTVYENLAFGLKLRKIPKDQIRADIDKHLKLVSMSGFEKKYPTQLSGGQQQRIAIARSLLLKPSVLLLDEPFSALDAKIRQQMREELKKIQAELGITVVFVTHDQEEAMALSHRIVVMNKGKFEQVGTPTEVYDNPATKYVASFIGEMNFIEKDGKTIAVRPEDVAITSEPADIQGCVRTIMVLGHYVEVNVQCGDLVVKCFVDRDQSERLTPGDPVNLKFLKTHIF